MPRRVLAHEIWPLNNRLRRVRSPALKALLEEADPSSGGIYENMPVPIVIAGHGSVRFLLGMMGLEGSEITDLEWNVERALNTEGIWIGKGVAIYRRLEA